MNCLSAAAVLVLTACGAQAQVPAPDIAFETHMVRWWGTEGSQQGRPIYRIARTDNGLLILHYSIVPGRVLTEYTMPYWPIRSCFALVSGPAEVAHHVFMHYTVDGQQKRLEFNPRSGIERAEHDGFFFLKIRNRSIASPEDATIPAGDEYSETTPCMAEHVFALRPGSPVVMWRVRSRTFRTGRSPPFPPKCAMPNRSTGAISVRLPLVPMHQSRLRRREEASVSSPTPPAWHKATNSPPGPVPVSSTSLKRL